MQQASAPVPSRGAWRREDNTVILDEIQVPDAVPPPFAISTESVFVTVPLEFEPHAHPVHELVWVRGGTMTVRLADAVITVPEGHGLWIPAGVVHSGRTTARTILSDALFDPQRSRLGAPAFAASSAVEVTPILASLLTHLERDDLSEQERLRAESVVFDVLAPAEGQLSLRVPDAERVGPIVAALLDDPTDDRTLTEWAALLGISERTVTRLFRAHTGLSFLQWRQVLRVHQALALLAEGLSVHEVAEVMGYAQPSTFIASFKRVMGRTPGAYTSTSATPARTYRA
ncbi:AraC family transcriptional regulator [Microbacterium sp. NPDC008134]|jgi:AraC-like DNA-binding protein/quercetin dioxygenase-like cupin family protein|uniref:helix-turn-helix transcriptional regulator n=1 Tax=Microbacterium sp. NPDC008134 TaxID=3364183 RepID=UPI0036F1887E